MLSGVLSEGGEKVSGLALPYYEERRTARLRMTTGEAAQAPARDRGRGPKSAAGQKVSLSLPIWMSRELENEADRLDRSVSWVLRRAWKLARAELRAGR